MRKLAFWILAAIMLITITADAAEYYAFDEDLQQVVLCVSEPAPVRPSCEELDAVMSAELQDHIWGLCRARGLSGEELRTYYAAMIGLAEGESEFNPRAYHDNGSSCDRGLYQVNSCHERDLKRDGLISTSEDLYDPYISATAGEAEFWKGYEKYGFSEESYACYLYGGFHKPNKWTHRVWDLMQEWKERIGK